jgi:predicted XRE-type DNA-binding protein
MAADPVLALRKQMLAAVLERLAHVEREELSQAELAELLGLTRARLSQLRQRQAAAFSMEALARIALRLDLAVRVSVTRPYQRD